MTEAEAATTLNGLGSIPFEVLPLWPLAVGALDIACRMQRTVYDSLYVALAVREQCALVTADRKLFNALRTGPLAQHVRWVEGVK